MVIDLVTIYVLLVIFLATLVRSAFGFGESLIAVPLLALFIPLEIAVPLAVLVSVTVAGVVVIQDWKKIHVHSAKWLVLFTLLGIPAGILLLKSADEQIVKAGLGVIIFAFSLYSLFSKNTFELKTDSRVWLFVCGLFAGIFGGAYGLNGPPLVMYGAMRRWSAQHFRATLHGYFLPASFVGMVGYWLSGLWVYDVTQYYLLTLPVVIPAIFLGRMINKRLKGEKFFKYVYVGLLCIGALLITQSIRN